MNFIDWNREIRNKRKEGHLSFLEIHIFIMSSSIFLRYIMNQFNDQLQVSLL